MSKKAFLPFEASAVLSGDRAPEFSGGEQLCRVTMGDWLHAVVGDGDPGGKVRPTSREDACAHHGVLPFVGTWDERAVLVEDLWGQYPSIAWTTRPEPARTIVGEPATALVD